MPLIAEERLLELAKKNPRKLLEMPMCGYEPPRNVAQVMIAAAENIDLDHIRSLLAAIRYELAVNRRQQGKGNRPWDVDPEMYTRLDRKQPWWGWEFELGYKSAKAYEEGVGYAYDNFIGATFDSEGEGNYPVEITFPPQEMSKYLDGTADAARFITWNAENAKRLANHTGANNIGTHLNMSDPRFTSLDVTSRVVNFLNRTLQHTRRTNGQRLEMFGRESIYAGFFVQQSGKNYWTEFKGFRSTYDVGEWQRYVQTAAALQKCIDYYFANTKGLTAKHGISNLYDVAFNGAEPELSTFDERVIAPGAAALSTRMGAYRDPDSIGGGHIVNIW